MKKRWILLNPGPVNVTESVRRALAGDDLCHREPEFSVLLTGVRQKLLKAFGIERTHTAAFFTGSGTLAVEAMLSSYGRGHKKILVLSNGVYGERLAQILRAHGLAHRVIASPLGSFPSPSLIENALKKDPEITAVAMVHHETSTGMLNPLGSVARLAKKYRKTFLVDAVSSLGAEAIDFSDIDFCAGSAGKCLHAFPGVSFALVSKKEAARLVAGGVYLDLKNALDSQEKGGTAFTPAVQLFYAFDKALDELLKETVAGRILLYRKKSALLNSGLARLGFSFLVPAERRSHVLSALWLPRGLSYTKLHDGLKKEGFVVYAGQSKLKDRIFRVSNLGEVSAHDLERFLKTAAAISRRSPKKMPEAIVLAAGVGKRFGRATKTTPKCLLPLGNGQTLLSRYLETFRALGLGEITIVVGHLKKKIQAECRRQAGGLRVRFIENKNYKKGSIVSLFAASRRIQDDVLLMDADVFFPTTALEQLLKTPHESAFLLDPRSKSSGEEMMVMAKNGRPWAISKKTDPKLRIIGEATGIVKIGRRGAPRLRRILRSMVRAGQTGIEYEEALSRLMKETEIGYEVVDGFWSEIDFKEDLEKVLKNAEL